MYGDSRMVSVDGGCAGKSGKEAVESYTRKVYTSVGMNVWEE